MEQRQIINWGIVALAALVVTVLQVVGGPVLWVMGLVLRIAILAALGWFMYTLWRNNRSRLQWLSRRQKLLFYGAAALLVAAVLISFLVPLMLFTSIFLLLIVGGCAFVMWRIYQDTAGWY